MFTRRRFSYIVIYFVPILGPYLFLSFSLLGVCGSRHIYQHQRNIEIRDFEYEYAAQRKWPETHTANIDVFAA